MTIGTFNPKEVDQEILNFWKKHEIYQKACMKNKDGKPFYFLQGPPYTSGKMHMGHAWNNSLKDIIMRFKRMQGFNVWDRAGYDMHGLPTAHKVQAKLNLKSKEDIINHGMDKFIKECMEFSSTIADQWNEEMPKLGLWFDYENAYRPITNEYIESVWFLIKKAEEKGRLYEGLRTLSWCAECATALAKHEQEYKEVTDNSIFVKFKIKNTDNDYFIIWTTTPWTIAFNLGIMVNPELDYVKCKVDNEYWIVSKALAAPVIQAVADKKLEIVEEFKGETLEGTEYTHPWENDIPDFKELKEKHPKVHTVLMSSEYVDTSAGSGLVHSAPGCGPEDYEVGHRNGIPPFNNIDHSGIFPDTMGRFSGLKAKTDDKKFIEALEDDNVLIASTPVEHDYAHCERCRNPVVFRATKQWFFKVEDMKDQMVEHNENINWVPDSGYQAYKSWLQNLRDNSITKQRFWGTPVPIWKCDSCDKYKVIDSREDIKNNGGQPPESLHKPWIDEVKLDCDCGSKMTRLPDVLDVWIDAGCASWACLEYPHKTEFFDKLFPAEFICEAKEQVRGWFNLLMVASMIAMDKPCFKSCYMHGMITDVDGVKMSKSLGNVISPYELIDKHGTDAMRYYICGTNAGEDISFSWDEAALKQKYLMILWNVHKFVIDLSKQLNVKVVDFNLAKELLGVEEKYILSKLNSTIKEVTELLNNYQIDKVFPLIENLYLELSRTYIQLVRDKAAVGSEEDKEIVFYTIYHTLFETLKIFSIITPFITEKMFQNLKEAFNLPGESIHLADWPTPDESMIDKKLESQFESVKSVIQSILSSREKINLGVRWPLKEAIVVTTDAETVEAVEVLKELILNQTNVKSLSVQETFPFVTYTIKPEFAKLGPEFGELAPKIIANLATQSPDTVLSHIKKEGKFKLKVESQEVDIKEEHINVDEDVKPPYSGGEFRKGNIYINSERSEELENEGFARELMRRIQNMRKKAGLQKTDSINIHITTDASGIEILAKWHDSIKEKVGANDLIVNDRPAAKKHETESVEKVKSITFEVSFDKV